MSIWDGLSLDSDIHILLRIFLFFPSAFNQQSNLKARRFAAARAAYWVQTSTHVWDLLRRTVCDSQTVSPAVGKRVGLVDSGQHWLGLQRRRIACARDSHSSFRCRFLLRYRKALNTPHGPPSNVDVGFGHIGSCLESPNTLGCRFWASCRRYLS
jgi:hypothetical protein